MENARRGDTRATTPVEIKQHGARALKITWADGAESCFDVRALRLACRCATCVDEWTGEQTLAEERVPQNIHPLKIKNVGRYALQIEWSDGHDTGLYPFQKLRALADADGDG